jgi:hypothetical protein
MSSVAATGSGLAAVGYNYSNNDWDAALWYQRTGRSGLGYRLMRPCLAAPANS